MMYECLNLNKISYIKINTLTAMGRLNENVLEKFKAVYCSQSTINVFLKKKSMTNQQNKFYFNIDQNSQYIFTKLSSPSEKKWCLCAQCDGNGSHICES